MKKPILIVILMILLLGVIGVSILWARGTFHVFSSRSSDAPSSNAALQSAAVHSGKVLIRLKEFEFGKDWNADFEITNDTAQPVFYVGSKDKYRFAYCTLAAKHQEQYQNIAFKIRDICYESTFLALQSLQPGESVILAVEKHDVQELLHPTDANSEVKAQIGFEVFVGEGKRREILWSDEVTFPKSDRL
jgi:hypothetical protein